MDNCKKEVQIRKLDISVFLSRRSQNEFAHFLEISLGSSYEVETQMEIARRLKYVKEEQFDNIITEVQSIEKRLTSLINTVRPE